MKHSSTKSARINYDEIYLKKKAYHHKFIENKNYYTIQRVGIIVALTREFGGSSILDVGCGDGPITSLLFDTGFPQIMGLDVSKEAIKMAREKEKRISFLVGSCQNLPFADESFETVLASEMLEHLTYPDGQLFLKEAKRVIKPNGRVIISVPNFSNPCLRALRMVLRNREHLKEYTKGALAGTISQHFKVIRHFTGVSLPLPLLGKLVKIPRSTQYVVAEKVVI